MAITKNTNTVSIDTVKTDDYFNLFIKEQTNIVEDDVVISSNLHRYVLQPDADTSAISDPVVLAQFNAVMTDEIKANYQAFLASQQPVTEEEGE
tara:strand:- start:245 stop:526 length:282 start_codon:yes stop_codon:yes gene_type:complete